MKALSAALVLVLSPAGAASAFDVNLVNVESTPEEKVVYAYHDYYGFPADDVLVVERARPSDAAVILEIAQAARVSPLRVLELRERGLSFGDILGQHGLSPSIFFVDVPHHEVASFGPPYGNAWGYWKKHGRRWPRTVALSDDEIVRVNDVKLQSRYFGRDPVTVIRTFERDGDARTILVRDVDVKLKAKAAKAARAHGAWNRKPDGSHESGGDDAKTRGRGDSKGKGPGKSKGKGN